MTDLRQELAATRTERDHLSALLSDMAGQVGALRAAGRAVIPPGWERQIWQAMNGGDAYVNVVSLVWSWTRHAPNGTANVLARGADAPSPVGEPLSPIEAANEGTCGDPACPCFSTGPREASDD